MPPPVYSERLGAAVTAARWTTLTVPIGWRAVLTSITLCNTRNDTTGYAVVELATFRLMLRYPAANSTENYALRQVLYGTEQLRTLVSVTGLILMVSGFWFEDPTGTLIPPGAWSSEPADVAGVLPASTS